MPRWNESEIVALNAEAALQAALETVDEPLFGFAEYDDSDFNMLYIAEELRALYPDDEQMLAHFGRIHSYAHIDFSEMRLFTDTLVPVADRVRYITTATDALTLVRFYAGEDGLFLALSPDEDVDAVVNAVEATIEPPE